MHHRLQSSMRENPASDRRHGSRQAGRTDSDAGLVEEKTATSPPPVLRPDGSFGHPDRKPNAAPPYAATRQDERLHARLMTVGEVAELLQVPSSWVYERTRLRCHNRIPGIRLGKYWRFQRMDIMHWIDVNRKKDYPYGG